MLRQFAVLTLVFTFALVVYATVVQMTGVLKWTDFLRRLVRR
jgi:hypothetical protein